MSTQEHYFDLLPAYALGSLENEQQLLVQEHLADCATCQQELQAYERVVNDFPLAMAQHEPVDLVKDRIMAHALSDSVVIREQPVNSWWNQLTNAMRSYAPIWGLSGLVVILILVVSNLFFWQRLNDLEITSQHALISIPMQGTETNPEAVGMIVVSQDGEHGTLIVDGLPALDEEFQYQLWLIRDGNRSSGGVFSVGTDGYGSLWVDAPEPLISYPAFGITVEPAGGSPGPTGMKVLGGEI